MHNEKLWLFHFSDSYNVDLESVSVSGISSGGHFVNNFMVAHSAFLKGGGTFAGCEQPATYCCLLYFSSAASVQWNLSFKTFSLVKEKWS